MKLRFVLYALLAASVPPLLAVFVTADVMVPAEAALESRLTAATASVRSRLEADEARRRELLVRLVSLSGLTEPLREAASRGRAPSAESVAQVRSAISDLFGNAMPEVFVVATAGGAQAVVTQGEPRAMPVEEVPLAKAALGGQIVDSFVRFDGSLFRFYAMPVGLGEAAILVGERVGVSTANRLRDHAKVDHISFVEQKEIVTASSLPVAERELALPAASSVGRSVHEGRLGTGLSLPWGFDEYLPILAVLDPYFPILAPSSRTRSLASELTGGVDVVVTISAQGTIGWLGRLQVLAAAAGLGLFLLAMVWLPLVYGPVKRQARSIEAHLSRLRVEHGARIGTKGFTKPFVAVAGQLDELAAHLTENLVPVPKAPAKEVTPRPPKPLDLPLQSAPRPELPDEPEGTPSAFPFGEPLLRTGTDPAPAVADAVASSPEPEAAGSSTVASVEPAVASQNAPQPVIPERIVESSGPVAAAPVPLPAPAPPAPKPDPFAAFGPAPEPDNERTREARIPEELLARSREIDPPLDPDEAHFREVFEQFCDARRKTGEGVDGLTVEKFSARLKKNREQLVARFACKTVRFHVYLKEGKAAIKASPVR